MVERAGFEPAFGCANRFTVCPFSFALFDFLNLEG